MKTSELKAKRAKLCVSQKELSVKTGISRYKISDFENGYCELSFEEHLKIQTYLDQVAEKRALNNPWGHRC